MPTKLERRLSSRSPHARRSIRPAKSEDSSDSDSGPGAVEEDFFTPPRQEQQNVSAAAPPRAPLASQVPQPARGGPAEKMKQAPAARGLGGRQPTGLSLAQPPVAADDPHLTRQRAASQSQGVRAGPESPHSYNSQRARSVVSDKELVEKSVLRHCQYLGDISQVPMTFNINNRSGLLGLIDNSRRQGRLPWLPHSKHNICLALCAKDIRLLDQRGQAVIVRLPLHTVAAVSYFHDDLQHLVTLHAGSEGDRSKGLLHIFHFSTQEAAEELCSIVSKCFDLLYTDATMAMLDESIVGEDLSPIRSSGKSLPRGLSSDQYYPNISSSLVAELHDVQRIAAPEQTSSSISEPKRGGILRQSSQGAMAIAKPPPAPAASATSSSIPSPSPPPPPVAARLPPASAGVASHPPPTAPPAAMPPPSQRPPLTEAVGESNKRTITETPGVGRVAVYDDTEDESDSGMRPGHGPVRQVREQAPAPSVTEEAAAVVQQYMKVMHHLVNSEELRQFATLVKDYRDSLPIAAFCGKLDTLFGPDRQFMLPGMRAFIPSDDQFYFESFLQEKGAAELKIPQHLLDI